MGDRWRLNCFIRVADIRRRNRRLTEALSERTESVAGSRGGGNGDGFDGNQLPEAPGGSIVRRRGGPGPGGDGPGAQPCRSPKGSHLAILPEPDAADDT